MQSFLKHYYTRRCAIAFGTGVYSLRVQSALHVDANRIFSATLMHPSIIQDCHVDKSSKTGLTKQYRGGV